MFAWLGRLWRRKQRRVDLLILWPVCVEKAPKLSDARDIFEVHALSDRAWRRDMSPEEIHEFVQKLG